MCLYLNIVVALFHCVFDSQFNFSYGGNLVKVVGWYDQMKWDIRNRNYRKLVKRIG